MREKETAEVQLKVVEWEELCQFECVGKKRVDLHRL